MNNLLIPVPDLGCLPAADIYTIASGRTSPGISKVFDIPATGNDGDGANITHYFYGGNIPSVTLLKNVVSVPCL